MRWHSFNFFLNVLHSSTYIVQNENLTKTRVISHNDIGKSKLQGILPRILMSLFDHCLQMIYINKPATIICMSYFKIEHNTFVSTNYNHLAPSLKMGISNHALEKNPHTFIICNRNMTIRCNLSLVNFFFLIKDCEIVDFFQTIIETYNLSHTN